MGVRVYPIALVMREWLDVSGNFVSNLVMILMNDFTDLAKVNASGKFGRYGRRPFPATA